MTAIDTVVVAYRSEDVIGSAVRAASGLDGDVFVIDHGDGASAARAEEAGAVVMADASNPGFGAGQNQGVARASTPLVLLCNPDAEIVPEAVVAGAALLASRPDVAAVQGVIVNRATGRPERSAGVELGPVHLLGRAVGARRLLRLAPVNAVARHLLALRDHVERIPDGPVEVESLAATALLIRAAAFEEIGGFDESYFLYGEDLDLCRRLRAAGWKLVAVPEVWGSHASGASAASEWDREVSWWRGTMQFAARWWSARSYLGASTAALIAWVRLAIARPSRSREAARDLLVAPKHQRIPRSTRPPEGSINTR